MSATGPRRRTRWLYCETRRYDAPPEERPALKKVAQRFHGRGAAVRSRRLPSSPHSSHGDGVSAGARNTLSIEYPSGEFAVIATLDADGTLRSAGVLRTARKPFDGVVFG